MPEDTKPDESNQPQPEMLQAPAEGSSAIETAAKNAAVKPVLFKRTTYRPSHKATFIGLGVIAAVIAVNIGIIYFVMQGQQKSSEVSIGEVALNQATLDKLGMSRNNVTDAGAQLTVGPSATFNGKVTIANDATVSGTTNLNGALTANDASITKLQAGTVDINTLNVSGDTKFNKLAILQDLTSNGSAKFQGTVTMSQLLTVNNNVNIAGSLAVGGTLSVRNFQASSLTSDTTLTIGGHIITRGNAPSVSAGSAVGPAGTVSISGSDAAGTVAVNVGVGGSSGILANITFERAFSSSPRVIVTAIGAGMRNVYVNRTASGFSIGTNDIPGPNGYAFDYIVMQ